MSQGYSGLPFYYVQSANPITPNLGLSLKGCDPIVAEDFVLIDAALGSISVIEINGSVVNSPNFNSTTPAAPAGYSNVIWQVSGSNVSAYVPAASSTTMNVVLKTAAYLAAAGDFVECDTSLGGFTVTLPASATNKGKTIIIKKISSDANTLTIACSGSDTLDGNATSPVNIPQTAVESTADGIISWRVY